MKYLLFIIIQIYYKVESFLIYLIPSKKEKTILFTKIDAIGDFVIWMDVADSLKNNFKGYKIVVIVNKVCFELAHKTEYFDEIISIDKNKWIYNPIYRFHFIKEISKRKFEKVINPIYSRDYYFQDQLIKVLKSDHKIGYLSEYSNNKNTLKGFIKNEKIIDKINLKQFKEGNKFYTQLIQPENELIMEKSRNAHFIRVIINPSFRSHIPLIPFTLPELSSFSNLKEKQYVIIFVGASTNRKMWPSKKYIELIQNLNNETVVISGGKGEEFIWNNILAEDHHHICENIVNLIGKTDLMELFSLIKHAKWIITNDTSASHICVITKTPSICILGGAHYGRFQPYIIEKQTADDHIPKIANFFMDCYNCNLNCKFIKNNKNKVWPCIEKIEVSLINKLVNEISF